MIRVGVLIGIKSSESEIAKRTAQNVSSALKSKGYEVIEIPIDENLAENLKKEKINVAFISAHGIYGEDGTVQGLLELLGIPYVGSRVLASALALNKAIAKKIFTYEGIPTPKWINLNKKDLEEKGIKEILKILESFKFPLAIKPSSQGSTIGFSQAKDEESLLISLENAFKYDYEIIIEEFIKGKEITASIFDCEETICFPLIEIIPKSESGVYDYQAKYTPGMSEHIIPARLSPETYKRAQELGVKAHKALGCRHFSRVDMIVEDKTEEIYVLEVNTIPGMTATSLYPEACRAYGIDFPELLHFLIEKALREG
ncbi:MAG: D-alanine--D-alanine ligase [Dictyoglomus sp.]|nr:D-alanine--D-alanine ligase [Dictyoglomus sp.]MCX7941720.1 D-alanine--D-alanine ligase [Dictyoglomaceae bacterium]MDW8189013.1 D-alanine--D-alanine ligase [Dictyoglomus sp.]